MYGGANASTQPEGWGDSNWSSDVQTHRSTTSFAFAFKSELFPSNLENKKMLLSFPLKLSTLLPFQMLKNVFGYINSLQIWATINLPLSLVFCDNQSSILLSKDPKFHNQFKHIAIRITIYKRWIPHS